jgi:hypothetical protein
VGEQLTDGLPILQCLEQTQQAERPAGLVLERWRPARYDSRYRAISFDRYEDALYAPEVGSPERLEGGSPGRRRIQRIVAVDLARNGEEGLFEARA